MPQEPVSYWTAVANIVRERPYGPGGAETRRGTKHFAPGAKVYIIDWYAGGCARIVAVGQHRSSKRMAKLVIDVNSVENLRAKVCYAPAVIAKIEEHYSPTRLLWLTREFAENVCQTIPFWQKQAWRLNPPASHALPTALRKLPDNPSYKPFNDSELAATSAPQPTRGAFLHRLWLSVSFWLKDS